MISIRQIDRELYRKGTRRRKNIQISLQRENIKGKLRISIHPGMKSRHRREDNIIRENEAGMGVGKEERVWLLLTTREMFLKHCYGTKYRFLLKSANTCHRLYKYFHKH